MAEQHAPGAQAMLGESGACPAIEWGGRKWKIGFPVQQAKAILEDVVTAKALARVERLQRLAPGRAKQIGDDFLALVGAGAYETWGSGWAAATAEAGGRHLFALALVRCHHPEATEDEVAGLFEAKPLEAAAALVRVAPDFFGHLAATYPGASPAQRKEIAAKMAANLAAGLRTSSAGDSARPTP